MYSPRVQMIIACAVVFNYPAMQAAALRLFIITMNWRNNFKDRERWTELAPLPLPPLLVVYYSISLSLSLSLSGTGLSLKDTWRWWRRQQVTLTAAPARQCTLGLFQALFSSFPRVFAMRCTLFVFRCFLFGLVRLRKPTKKRNTVNTRTEGAEG